MIQAINNISFKALWQKPHKYSAEQSRTITEIKAKLGERPFSNDYMIEPSTKEDSVNLYKFDNLKTKNGQRLSYEKKNFIGTYSQTHPFMIKDLNELEPFMVDDLNPSEKFNNSEEKRNKIATLILLGLGILSIIIVPLLPNNKAVNKINKNKIENVVKPVVDSLELAKKDSLNLIK